MGCQGWGEHGLPSLLMTECMPDRFLSDFSRASFSAKDSGCGGRDSNEATLGKKKKSMGILRDSNPRPLGSTMEINQNKMSAVSPTVQ